MSRSPEYDAALEHLSEQFDDFDFLDGFGAIPENEVVEKALAITRNMLATYEAKDTDYSANDLPMGNFRESTELGIEPWIGIMLRIGDKKRRIASFIKRAQYLVADEGVDDTLIDAANYALLGYVLYIDWFHEFYGKPAPSSTQTELFFTMARAAIRTKILYEYRTARENDNDILLWSEEPWDEFLNAYSEIAKLSRWVIEN